MRLLPTFALATLAGLAVSDASAAEPTTLVEARASFHTTLLQHWKLDEPAPAPPPEAHLALVSYPAPLGKNAAYVSPNPGDHRRHAAIIWLVGGFSNSVGSVSWERGRADNDQSAAGFRDQGILMMYPSLRGGNDNPGELETFYGEVDDVLAAARYLATLDYVDPQRIYLGGHSTGGTLALLVAEAAGPRFRAVFSLGPVDGVARYGRDMIAFDLANNLEFRLRAPVRWLQDIRCPTYVFEGTAEPSNLIALKALQSHNTNPLVHFSPEAGRTHFSVIVPLVRRLAAAIAHDPADSPVFVLP